MGSDQILQFFLFLEQRPLSRLVVFLTVSSPPASSSSLIIRVVSTVIFLLRIAHQLSDIVSLLFVIAPLVSGMVDTQHPTHDRRTAQIVHGQVGTPLILVFQPGESAALACFLVAREVYVHGLAVLRKNGDDITFGQVEGQSADVDVGRISVIRVP